MLLWPRVRLFVKYEPSTISVTLVVENGIKFHQPGGVQILTRTDRDHSFWHGLETNTLGNYVWHMLNSMMMSVSNTICVLYINCKTVGFLFLVDLAPGGQIYVSTFSHQNYWYYWWFLLHVPLTTSKSQTNEVCLICPYWITHLHVHTRVLSLNHNWTLSPEALQSMWATQWGMQ